MRPNGRDLPEFRKGPRDVSQRLDNPEIAWCGMIQARSLTAKPLAPRLVRRGKHRCDRLLECLASVHVHRVYALINICFGNRKGTSPAGHMQNVAEVAVASHIPGDDSVGTCSPPKDRRAGFIAEDNACVAVFPVDDGAELVRTDHQNRIGGLSPMNCGSLHGRKETQEAAETSKQAAFSAPCRR